MCESHRLRSRTKLALLAATLCVLALLGVVALRDRDEAPASVTASPGNLPTSAATQPTTTPLELTDTAIAGRVLIDLVDRESPAARVCVQPAEIVMAGKLGGWSPNFALHTRCVDAEPDGRYRLGGLSPGRLRVSASAPGFVPVIYHQLSAEPHIVLRRGEQREGLDLHLQIRGAPVHGVVHDVAGGTIAAALVSDTDGAHAFTGEDGEFTLWVYPGISAYIGAIAPGYTADARFARPPQPPLHLYLTPESVLRGRVVRADTGAPLPELPVHLQRDAIVDAETLADGSFEIRGLDPGRYKPFVRSAGWCGSPSAPIGLGIGETSEALTISARPCRTVTARVRVRPSGQPCPSAQVDVLDAVEDSVRKVITDLSGEVQISGLAAGAYTVKIVCPGHIQRTPEPWLLDDAMATSVTWEVEPGRTLRGKVVDDGGRPIAVAYVTASSSGSGSDYWGHVQTETDADGLFTLPGIHPGAAQVGATHHPLGTSEALQLDIDEARDPSPVILRVATATLGRIRGQVRARLGALPPGLTAVVHAVENFSAKSLRVAGDGSFLVEGLLPGPYNVTIQRYGGLAEGERAGTLAKPILVDLGSQAEERVEFVLDIPPSAPLALRVEDADGSPEPDALVNLRSEILTHRGLTDEAGHFALEVPDLGDYTISVTARDGNTLRREGVKPGPPLVLRFPASRRVCGTVTASVPVTGDFTVALKDGPAESFSDTDRWCLDRVPIGTHTISARSPALGVAQARVHVSAAGGLTGVILTFAGRSELRGKVVDGTGQPRAKFKVWIFDATGRLVGGNLYTDDTGEFALPGAPAGELTVVPMPVGPMPARDALLASGTKVQVRADRPPAPVVLTVP